MESVTGDKMEHTREGVIPVCLVQAIVAPAAETGASSAGRGRVTQRTGAVFKEQKKQSSKDSLTINSRKQQHKFACLHRLLIRDACSIKTYENDGIL